MPPNERRLRRARQNPKNVRFNELVRIYEDHGFIVRPGRGSHYVAKLPGTRIRETIPRQNPMKPRYVKKALDIIDEFGL